MFDAWFEGGGGGGGMPTEVAAGKGTSAQLPAHH